MTGRMVEAVDSLLNKMEVGHDGNRKEGEQQHAVDAGISMCSAACFTDCCCHAFVQMQQ